MAPMRGSLKGNVSMCPLWSPNYTFNCVLDKGASSGGGARIGKRRLLKYYSGSAAGPSESLCSNQIEVFSLRHFHQLTSVAFGATAGP